MSAGGVAVGLTVSVTVCCTVTVAVTVSVCVLIDTPKQHERKGKGGVSSIYWHAYYFLNNMEF